MAAWDKMGGLVVPRHIGRPMLQGQAGSKLAVVGRGLTCDLLMLAGGGGGARSQGADYGGGGGGAGGFFEQYGFVLPPGRLSVFVGKGGRANNGTGNGWTYNDGERGQDTVLYDASGREILRRFGGGPGALLFDSGISWPQPDARRPYGSGAGRISNGADIGSYGTPGQGFNGGKGQGGAADATPGGGGGAGGPGEDAIPVTRSGNGGRYVRSAITGTMDYYGGGGGGGRGRSPRQGKGGGGTIDANERGNSGNGADMDADAANVHANTGGGGGGGCSTASLGNPANGGSGVLIIRYKSPLQIIQGGTVTSFVLNGAKYQVHQFTSLGLTSFLQPLGM